MNKSYLIPIYVTNELLNNVIKIESLIEDLHNRLVEDYNGGESFQQYEEDRLSTYKVLELIQYLRTIKEGE
jgi:hypothetical protein